MNKKVFLTLPALLLVAGLTWAYVSYTSLGELEGTDHIDLCFKSAATGWQCADGPSGTVDYSIIGDKAVFDVRVDGLDKNKAYQITLNGNGANEDMADTKLSEMSTDPYVSGMWGSEGWFNFEMNAVPTVDEATGECARVPTPCYCYVSYGVEKCYTCYPYVCDTEEEVYIEGHYELDLPVGVYNGIKFIVKENADPWTAVSMETEAMDFVVI